MLSGGIVADVAWSIQSLAMNLKILMSGVIRAP